MRVAIAQLDMTVGDISGNAGRAIEALRSAEAAGAELSLLPELALTGYPPEDLLAKQHFIDDNLRALGRVAGDVHGRAVVGFVDREGSRLYNAAALCGEGRVLATYRKRSLPNYGVFDERRYFDSGKVASLEDIGNKKVAITVCEDIWTPEIAAEVSGAGADVLLNISASPFSVGKGADREHMLCERARANRMWLAYCNLVGGQDELVFDGRSVVISPAGEVVARAKAFEEDLLICDLPLERGSGVDCRVAPALNGLEEVYSALRLGLADYVAKNGFSDAVIGLSGGIDSALTATLAVDALGAEHVHGVMMPSIYSSEGSLTDARALAEALGIETCELSIEGPFHSMTTALAPALEGFAPDVTEENIQARIRGTLLMALSNKRGWLVLATGNKSELSVGYSTLYGDMVGGFAPLKDVFKTRVYELARWRNSRGAVIPDASITKAPSAELRPMQTDQDSLPPYDVLDEILEAYVERDLSVSDIVARGYDAALVERVCGMVDASEYKRRQGPLGIKISSKAFGKDRRMPVTNRFHR